MSDIKPPSNGVPSSFEQSGKSFAELADRLLGDRKARVGCPICGNRRWSLVDAPNVQTVTLSPLALNHKIFSLVCTNCGFLRYHMLDVLTGEIDIGPREPLDIDGKPAS